MTLFAVEAKPGATPSQTAGMQLSVVIPTFKERGNVAGSAAADWPALA